MWMFYHWVHSSRVLYRECRYVVRNLLLRPKGETEKGSEGKKK